MTTAVRFQALPPLSPDEYRALEQSILANGIWEPIKVDEGGVVIDGHHRQKIALEHGLHCPQRTIRGLDDVGKRTMALSMNLDRRHLTREQRRALVAESIKADPQLSDREHGRRTGVSPTTAGTVRQELESDGLVSKLDTRTGGDGVPQPASKPPRAEVEGDQPPHGPPEPDAEIVCRDCDGYGCETCYPADDSATDEQITAADEPVEPQPQKPRRRPLEEGFFDATMRLNKAVTSLENLGKDDRLPRNKNQVARYRHDLIRASDALQRVADQLA